MWFLETEKLKLKQLIYTLSSLSVNTALITENTSEIVLI